MLLVLKHTKLKSNSPFGHLDRPYEQLVNNTYAFWIANQMSEIIKPEI